MWPFEHQESMELHVRVHMTDDVKPVEALTLSWPLVLYLCVSESDAKAIRDSHKVLMEHFGHSHITLHEEQKDAFFESITAINVTSLAVAVQPVAMCMLKFEIDKDCFCKMIYDGALLRWKKGWWRFKIDVVIDHHIRLVDGAIVKTLPPGIGFDEWARKALGRYKKCINVKQCDECAQERKCWMGTKNDAKNAFCSECWWHFWLTLTPESSDGRYNSEYGARGKKRKAA